MPPQTPPLDRREMYQDNRRHDRGPGPGGGGGGNSEGSRWRDPYYSSSSSRDYSRRPQPPGYYRGGYGEESGPRGGTPSRSDRFWHEEQSYNNGRSYSNRYDRGRVGGGGGGRDVRGGPYSYRRSPTYDPYHADCRRSPQYDPYPAYPYQYPAEYNPRHHPGIRSVAVPISSSSRVIPDHRTNYYRRPCWEQRKSDWNRDRDRDRDRDRGDRKPPYSMKWSRSDSIPREASKQASESPRKRSREEVEATASPDGSPEEDLSKKARLGWGQGLAKYEKLKVGPTDDIKQELGTTTDAGKDNAVGAAKDAPSHEKEADSESCICQEASSASARDALGQEPTSAVESDLPAAEQQHETDGKPCTSTANTNYETVLISKMDPLDGSSIDALANLLTDLLRPDDTHNDDLTLMRRASLDELSQLKEFISKHLVTTEAEIDSLETELKLVLPDHKSAERETNTAPVQTLGLPQPISETKHIEIRADDTNASLISTILAANWDASKLANSLVDNGLHLTDLPDLQELVDAITAQNEKKDLRLKEQLCLKKSGLKFKQEVLARKYRLLRDMWRDEQKLISSSKKVRTKTTRSRLISDAGELPPFATGKASDFALKLMSDSYTKPYRPHLKMPAQILDEVERTQSIFVSQNGLVDNPVALEKERALINPWTQKEKEKFMEMICLFGKDFAKISSFLPHKTTADCVEFYYKSHKSDSFVEVRKHLSARKAVATGNYLGSQSVKKRKRELNAVSLDELGQPSVLAVQNSNRLKGKTSTKKVKNSGSKNKSSSSNKKRSLDSPVAADRHSKNSFSLDKKSVDLPVVGFQKVNVGCLDRAKSTDAPSCIPWTHSLEGMSSCITASPGDKEKSFEDDEDECSDDGWQDVGPAWTDIEKSLLVQGWRLYGNDFERISALVATRNRDQCKTFFSKSWRVLNLEAGFPGNDSVMADAEGAKAASNEVCDAATESGTCSTQSCSKQEYDGFRAAPSNSNDVRQVHDSEEIPEITSDKVCDVIVFGKLMKLSSCAAELCENEIKGSLGKVGLGVGGNNIALLEEYLSDKRRSSMLDGFTSSKSKETIMQILPVSDPVENLEKS